jgi:hypothetical protein
MPAPTTQLKADLKMIGDAIKRADGVPDSIKTLFGELVAWNEAIVEHAKDLDERLESSEAAIDEILEGAGEMISPETAATLISSIEHGQLLCQATSALLEGPLSSAMDEVSKKRFGQLIEFAQKAFALSSQVIAEITAADDEGDEDGNDGDVRGDDGDGDADGGEEVASDEEGDDE